ncbi:hypothetical protein OF829_17495 [Sphingomonas sp. LB-2]|uniref:hypothetical protein n=1 Tax=Sphingomonas caeni TaxID=2984949 RepID=UPI0022304BE8|nr:hypothetical protein [Sphingomonas caeni]MCW3849037.1 hypothetical protein [Sphingomonas caeni]
MMRLLPMDVPAEIHRRVSEGEGGRLRPEEIIVARGPLVIMAHGLMAVDASARGDFWITSEMGDLSFEEAEEALRRWSAKH